jgi:uncharacterized protein with HEPN domain
VKDDAAWRRSTYIGVDLEEVWNVASARIPELQAVLEQFLAGESTGSPPVA